MSDQQGRKRGVDADSTISNTKRGCVHKIKIGEGSTSRVYAGAFPDGRSVVIKQFVLCEKDDPACNVTDELFLHEINIHWQLTGHRNVVSLIAKHHQEKKLGHLVMERCPENLREWLRCHGERSTVETGRMMRDLLQAVAFCHSKRVMHRDIKPENILVAADGTLKLADFGMAHQFDSDEDATIGRLSPALDEYVSLWYRPPELFLIDMCRHSDLVAFPTHSYAADMWAVGCVMVDLRFNMPLFRADTVTDLFFRVYRTIGSPRAQEWPEGHALFSWLKIVPSKSVPEPFYSHRARFGDEGTALLARMVCNTPNKRITAVEALSHPYLCTKE